MAKLTKCDGTTYQLAQLRELDSGINSRTIEVKSPKVKICKSKETLVCPR